MAFPKIAATGIIFSLLPAIAAASGPGTEKAKIANSDEGEFITMTGKVIDVTMENFKINHGDGKIVVEMDDYDWYNENVLMEGDMVTVVGRLDKQFYQDSRVEAASVYVDNLDTFFYANPEDEESGLYANALGSLGTADEEWIGLTGSIAGAVEGESFTLNAGDMALKVDTSGIDSATKLDAGDRVAVYGEMDDSDLLESREILATSVVKLQEG